MANVTAITKWANASPDNFARWVVRNRGTLENNGIRIWADLSLSDPAKIQTALERAEAELADLNADSDRRQAQHGSRQSPAEATAAWSRVIEAVNARVGARQ